MGSYFSKQTPATARTNSAPQRPPPNSVSQGTLRLAGTKRDVAATGPAEPKLKRLRTEPKHIDVEDLHRFCVGCPTIYWLVKKDIAKLLRDAKDLPEPVSIHKISRWDFFYATFHVKDIPAARKSLLEMRYRGTPFEVRNASLRSERRRRSDAAISNGPSRTKPREASDVTAPWAHIPYKDQCERKTTKWSMALQRITGAMRSDRHIRSKLSWVRALADKDEVCALKEGIFCETGEQDFYRNKAEFTIGMSSVASENEDSPIMPEMTVGYALGLSRKGDFRVGKVTEKCRTTSRFAMKVADVMGEVVRASGQPAYDRRNHEGYWRLVTVRESTRNRAVLVMVMVCAEGAKNGDRVLSDGQCRDAVVDGLRNVFCDDVELGVFWQQSAELMPTPSTVSVEHVFGLKFITESLCGLRFAVDPAAFFQVNTPMAERLYKVIRQFAAVTKNSSVLDVCCGTGTIALTMARHAHSVVGVDICEAAIFNARANAKSNGLGNASFVAGAVERVISHVVELLPDKLECVAVLDPPRDGVASSVIAAVRCELRISRVVYVACKPENAWKNIVALCRPQSKQFRGDPFRPTKSIGVDLFPHTPHGELVLLLERNSDDKKL